MQNIQKNKKMQKMQKNQKMQKIQFIKKYEDASAIRRLTLLTGTSTSF